MSGLRAARVELSAEALAELYEQQRQQRVHRRWKARMAERARLCAAVEATGLKYGLAVRRPAELTELASVASDAVARAEEAADTETHRIRAQLGELRRMGLGKVVAARTANIGPASKRTQRVASKAPSPQAEDTTGPSAEDPVQTALGLVGTVDSDADVPPAVQELVDEIAAAPAARQSTLLRALRGTVRDLNARTRRRRREAELLDELAGILSLDQDEELSTLLTAAKADHEADRALDIDQLRAQAVAAEDRQFAVRAHQKAMEALVKVLQRKGYHTVAGVSVVIPGDGVLLQHKNNPGHAMSISTTGEQLRLEPVRIERKQTLSRSPDRVADTNADKVLCDAGTQALHEITALGYRVRADPPGIPGAAALRIVHVDDTTAAPANTTHTGRTNKAPITRTVQWTPET